MRHTTNIASPIHVGFESGLRVVEAHSQTAVVIASAKVVRKKTLWGDYSGHSVTTKTSETLADSLGNSSNAGLTHLDVVAG